MYAIGHTRCVADALKEASDLAESFRNRQPSIEEAKRLVQLISAAGKEAVGLANILIAGEKAWEDIKNGDRPTLNS
jgi:hypothetical protein